MRFDLNIAVYGKGKRLLLETVGAFDGETADSAIEKARAHYRSKGTVVVRGATPSVIQGKGRK